MFHQLQKLFALLSANIEIYLKFIIQIFMLAKWTLITVDISNNYCIGIIVSTIKYLTIFETYQRVTILSNFIKFLWPDLKQAGNKTKTEWKSRNVRMKRWYY